MPYRVENMVRKGEIACYKQFLLFSQCFPQLYISLVRENVALCGNNLNILTEAPNIMLPTENDISEPTGFKQKYFLYLFPV